MYATKPLRNSAGMQTQYIKNKMRTDRISLRSAMTQRYERKTTLLKFGKLCFSHAGPKVWNSLLHAIQKITDSFKHKLKTFLFKHAFPAKFLTAGHFRCKCWTAWIKLNWQYRNDAWVQFKHGNISVTRVKCDRPLIQRSIWLWSWRG